MISLRRCRAEKDEAQGETSDRNKKPSSLKDAVFHNHLRMHRCVGASTDCGVLPFLRAASLGPLRGTIRPRSELFRPRSEVFPDLIRAITPEMQRRWEHLRKTSKHCVPREGERMDVEEEVDEASCADARGKPFAALRDSRKKTRRSGLGKRETLLPSQEGQRCCRCDQLKAFCRAHGTWCGLCSRVHHLSPASLSGTC